MVKRFRRMSDSDINTIVADLDRWALGELGSKLTWAVLEERFGFSRQYSHGIWLKRALCWVRYLSVGSVSTNIPVKKKPQLLT